MTEGGMSQWPAVDRFLAREGLSLKARDLFVDPKRQRLSALCYVERDGRVLMIRRRKEPFAGYWTAPGGKLLPGEDPREAVRREVREETGIELAQPELRLACSESGDEHYNWVLFVFRARPREDGPAPGPFDGARDTAEGIVDWLPADRLPVVRIPDVDRQLLPYIFAPPGTPPYLVRIRYGPDHGVERMDIERLGPSF
ncbi:MAG: NUDIX domain-containing protein [Firmicutes bacterium]|nr:NUDIX domain-containing protein [Bacillota bacterium]